jgi:hypothetical protein
MTRCHCDRAEATAKEDARMRLAKWFATVVGAGALGFVVLPAEAAPVGAAGLTSSVKETPGVHQVHYRYRYYRYYRYRPEIYFYYGPRYYSSRRHYRRLPSQY